MTLLTDKCLCNHDRAHHHTGGCSVCTCPTFKYEPLLNRSDVAQGFDCIICGALPVPYSNNSCLECTKLVDAAVAAIRKARRDGVPKYGPNLWKTLSVTEHLEHAKDHMMYLDFSRMGINPTGEDHLSHAICRLVMAMAVNE